MFLEKLDIFGFKSIPFKLTVRFGAGITGIVGPNGCGKSNLSDAIRWVLGEQSARLLRGHSMEDVIFNGTAARKPLGMAEVFLTFSNTKNLLPVEYSTVSVGRRLYRSGQSDYVLNRKPCRLRDVKDLLLDTGIGSSGYSLIAREMVESVLSDDSGQRRQILEEAAGITKYKARKHEALLKLKATEADLVRVADIISEVERETHSLGRQVGRARRYKRHLERIRHLDLALGRQRVHELAARRDELVARLAESRAQLEGERARLASLELTVEERRLRQTEFERELRAAQEELDRHDRQVAEWTSEVRVLRERELATQARLSEARSTIGRLNERDTGNARAAAASGAELERLAESAAQVEGELAAREELRNEVERTWKARRVELAEKNQMSLELVEGHVERRTALAEEKRKAEDLTLRRDRLVADLDTVRNEWEAAAGESERLAAALGGARGGCEATRAELDEVEARTISLSLAAEQAGQKLLGLAETAATHESRLAVLLDLRRRYEGFARGVQTLLAGERPGGMHGTIAELIRVPAELVEAVEAALGAGVGTILVEERAAPAGYIDQLREREGGRATFLPLAGLETAPEARGGAPAGDGIWGRLSDLVEAHSERFAGAVEYMLGDVIVVADRSRAQALIARPEAQGYRVVTLDGELWTRSGAVSGGDGAGTSVLSREQEIAATEEALVPLRAEIAALRAEEADLRAEREASAGTLRELRSRYEAEREAVFACEKAHAEAALAAQIKAEVIRDLEGAIAALAQELAASGAREVALGSELDDARRESQTFASDCADLEAEVAHLEEERDRRLAEEQEARMAWAAFSARLAEVRADNDRLAAERGEIAAELARLGGEIELGTESLAMLATTIAEHETATAQAMLDREEKEARVRALELAEGEARAEVVAEEKEVRTVRHGFDGLLEGTHKDELDHERARGEIEAIAARIREEYGVELLETNETLAEGQDPAAALDELNELRERLRRIGPVNLLAIEQYDEVKQRFDFLTKQRDDLVAARTELLEAIEKINLTASELFHQTFAQVQANFSRVFATLFEGGEAELALAGDDLEGGIEIMARPRGKALRSIRMMSGGERALTAISLLFSIYLVKPSPFCIMDEVDAPLDDANVDRFVKLLRQFQRDTQFIVITHNKRTMEACERLYGVTMEEPGVSKLVSVRLDHGEIAAGEEVETAAGEESETAAGEEGQDRPGAGGPGPDGADLDLATMAAAGSDGAGEDDALGVS